MHVLLVSPYQATPAYVLPNLGLGYLAGAVLQANHRVVYLDCPRDRVDRLGWERFLRRDPPEVIGIQCFSFNYDNVQEMLRVARGVCPKAVLVCGGPHATVAGEQMLSETPELDFVVQSEGEEALPALLKALAASDSLDEVPNLLWRRGGEIRINPLRRLESLDDLPDFPWYLMAPASYPVQPHGVLNRANPIAPMMATRGCPGGCSFCSAGEQMGMAVRQRSPQRVVDEMETLVRSYGVHEIHFEDDNLTHSRAFAEALCDEILRRRLRVHWACPNGVRLDRLDGPLVRKMEQAGCYSMAVGIESGSARMLQRMNKRMLPEQAMEALRMVRGNSSIWMTGFFVIGHPGETMEDLELTERFVMAAPLDRISLSPFMPLPGTKATRELVRAGKLPARPDWGKLVCYQDDDYVSYCEIPAEKLLAWGRKVSLRFYGRPRIMANIVRRVHSVNQVKVMSRYLLYLMRLQRARHW